MLQFLYTSTPINPFPAANDSELGLWKGFFTWAHIISLIFHQFNLFVEQYKKILTK